MARVSFANAEWLLTEEPEEVTDGVITLMVEAIFYGNLKYLWNWTQLSLGLIFLHTGKLLLQLSLVLCSHPLRVHLQFSGGLPQLQYPQNWRSSDLLPLH